MLSRLKGQHRILEMVTDGCSNVDYIDAWIEDEFGIGIIRRDTRGNLHLLTKVYSLLLRYRRGHSRNLVTNIVNVTNHGVREQVLGKF